MTSLILPAFLASVAGSLHCAGMCGPFAAFWSEPGSARGSLRAGLAYHGARLITYAALGALAGGAGRALDEAVSGRVRAGAALAAGLVLVAWGLAGLLRHWGVRLPSLPLPRTFATCAGRAMSSLREKPPAMRAAIVGLLTTLLPCGWLHAFVLAAAATGSAPAGALFMAAFWAGTVPVLSAVGGGAGLLRGPLRRHAPALSAATVLLLGVLALIHHARVLSSPEPCHDPNAPLTRALVTRSAGGAR